MHERVGRTYGIKEVGLAQDAQDIGSLGHVGSMQR